MVISKIKKTGLEILDMLDWLNSNNIKYDTFIFRPSLDDNFVKNGTIVVTFQLYTVADWTRDIWGPKIVYNGRNVNGIGVIYTFDIEIENNEDAILFKLSWL